MIRRSADDGQAKRHIHPIIKVQCLQGDERLIMISAHRNIIAFAGARMKHSVRRKRAGGINPFADKLSNGRADNVKFFTADLPAFSAVRIIAGKGEARIEALRLCEIFRAKVVDSTLESFVFEMTGTPEKIDAFADLMRPLGLCEIARTGVAALSRGV